MRYTSLLITIFLFSEAVFARVKLPAIFSSNMVLQQKTTVAIWGKADAGKTVTTVTSWDHKEHQAVAAADGNWKIKFSTPSYGGPYELTVSDGDITRLDNIMIGEVWLCSGQSNMEMPLAGWGKINNYQEEIAAANYPDIRLLQVEKAISASPLDDVKVRNGSWEKCSPQTIEGFSSTAYFFAREIYNKTGIPVGLIHTSWGGTIIEAWTSASALKQMPAFKDSAEKIERIDPSEIKPGKPNRATLLYNAMIHPLIQFPVKGFIWYQGESNADRAYQYQELFAAMIQDWRTKWDRGNLPFYFVQLANFRKQEDKPGPSAWAELREAQSQALSLPNTGMAVTIDIGDAKDIHPKNKQEVGRRLALIALAKDYHIKTDYSGPVFKSQKIKDRAITLRFTSADGGLQAKGADTLKGFAIAGADQKFYWANAAVKGNKVVVSSPDVPAPVAVRYGWANNPDGNLYNGAGLPASPFRTDDWPGITKK